jgi:hypothetical protein
MCSGTEGSLLAWDIISECLESKESDLELKFEQDTRAVWRHGFGMYKEEKGDLMRECRGLEGGDEVSPLLPMRMQGSRAELEAGSSEVGQVAWTWSRGCNFMVFVPYQSWRVWQQKDRKLMRGTFAKKPSGTRCNKQEGWWRAKA